MNRSEAYLNGNRRNRVIARALACATLFVLPACHIPGLRPPEPGPGLPASFSGASGSIAIGSGATRSGGISGAIGRAITRAANSDSSSQVGIQEFYNDPTLMRLICKAISGNLELKILDEEIQIATNEVLARRGAYLPFVNIGAGAGLEKPSRYTTQGAIEDQLEILPEKRFPDPLANFRLAANFSWEVDIWRALRNARDAAALRSVGLSERRNYVVTRLVAEIAESYYELMALDKRLETLDKTIELQEQSLKIAEAKKAAGRGTELAVQRFQAEVRKNQSEKLIVNQDIIQVENRINFLLGRFPQPVERTSTAFLDLNIHTLKMGVPSQLLQNRPDIRQAERELEAAGLDVQVARARFYPQLTITGSLGYEVFNPKYLLNTPEALIANVAGELVAPLINRRAIEADYLSANARQLQAVYNYQRVILNAFTEVVNRVAKVENYGKSIELKKQQLQSLEASVDSASKLFDNARAEYIEVLFAQRDLMEARMVLIDTKKEQLSAIVNAYQALGGGADASAICNTSPNADPWPLPEPGQLPLPQLMPAAPKQQEGQPASAVMPFGNDGLELMPVTRIGASLEGR